MQARAFLQQIQWFALAATTLVLGAWLLGGSVLAGRPSAISQPPSPQPPQKVAHALTNDAYLEFVPGHPGNCQAPPNGGTTYVGCRFVLDLILDAGSSVAPNGFTAQQSYLTFTYELIQNARVSTIATSCTLTSTVTGDLIVFDAILQNEVCNGPGICVFPGIVNQPGWWAYASGALSNCPEGCPDDIFPDPRWRVAQTGWCATNPGQAILHWQFSPPAPPTRDTQIVGVGLINPALFEDYIFNIVVPSTGTPTPRPTRVIDGHVTWDGRDPQPDPSQMLPISLTLRPKNGGPYIDFPMQDTDENGYFAVDVTNLQTGEYYWRVKGPKYLANSGILTLAGDPVTPVEMGLMLAGDSDGNNAVNISDFNIMKGTFGWSCVEGDYDERAEFTGDCHVSVVDFLRMKLNFGATGAP